MRAFPLRVGVIDVGVMGTDYVERLAQRTAGALRSPTQMRRGPLTGQHRSAPFEGLLRGDGSVHRRHGVSGLGRALSGHGLPQPKSAGGR
jgi:hypothetical protein